MSKKDTKSFASKGGKARAEALSDEKRSEISRNAARARWEKEGRLKQPPIVKATHIGELKIGDMVIPCAVLEDGSRVLSMRGINKAFTGNIGGGVTTKSGAQNLPRFLATKAVKSTISNSLMTRLTSPIEYQPLHGGRSAFGYEATLLPEICEVLLDAEKSGSLKNLAHAKMAEILIRGFARLGIIALVDEATGYQSNRARNALEKILNEFISKELQKWTKTFPDEYYQEIFRLNNWAYPLTEKHKKPRLVGKYTKNIIYDRLAPGVLKELERKNPLNEKGRRKHTHHQHLSEDIGHPKLREQISNIITLMKASSSWKGFMRLINKAIPSKNTNMELFEDDV